MKIERTKIQVLDQMMAQICMTAYLQMADHGWRKIM